VGDRSHIRQRYSKTSTDHRSTFFLQTFNVGDAPGALPLARKPQREGPGQQQDLGGAPLYGCVDGNRADLGQFIENGADITEETLSPA
jgi:hypothetical protein